MKRDLLDLFTFPLAPAFTDAIDSPSTNGLTAEKLRATLRLIRGLDAARPAFTIYGSPVIDHAYEICSPDPLLFDPLRFDPSRGRRVLIVPKDQELVWFHSLRDLGCDVELNPQVRQTETKAGET